MRTEAQHDERVAAWSMDGPAECGCFESWVFIAMCSLSVVTARREPTLRCGAWAFHAAASPFVEHRL